MNYSYNNIVDLFMQATWLSIYMITFFFSVNNLVNPVKSYYNVIKIGNFIQR